MSQTLLKTSTGEEKSVSAKKAIVVIVAALIVVVLGGILIGQAFFWDKYDTSSREDQQLRLAMSRVKQEPNNAEARVELGWTYFQKGNVEAAIKEYKTALELDSSNLKAKFNLASADIEAGNLEEAQTLMEEYVQKNAMISTGHSLLGLIYQQKSEYEESIKEFEKSILLVPGNTNVYFQLAISYERAGNKDKALENYQKTLDYNPNFTQAKEAIDRLKGK